MASQVGQVGAAPGAGLDVVRANPDVSAAPKARRGRIGDRIATALLVLFAAIWFVPLAWAVATALKPEAETTDVPVSWFASTFTFEAFRSVLSAGNLPRWYFNSALTSLAITSRC